MSDEIVIPSSGEISTYENVLWSVPEAFIPDPDLRQLYDLVIAQLLSDNPDADGLERLMIERIGAVYMFIRYRESVGDVDSLTAYHKNLELWAKLVDQLRRKRIDNAVDDSNKQKILTGVQTAFQKTLQGMEPELANHIRQRFAKNLSEV